MAQFDCGSFLQQKFAQTASTSEGVDALRWVNFEFSDFDEALIQEMKRRRLAALFQHFSDEDLQLAYLHDDEDQPVDVFGLIKQVLNKA